MATPRALALQRLHNRLRHLTDWPREQQLAALEDALCLAFPADSPHLREFRSLAAELVNLELRSDDLERDLPRLRQIEARIDYLIEAADQPSLRLPTAGTVGAAVRAWRRLSLKQAAAALGSGVAVAGPMALGALWWSSQPDADRWPSLAAPAPELAIEAPAATSANQATVAAAEAPVTMVGLEMADVAPAGAASDSREVALSLARLKQQTADLGPIDQSIWRLRASAPDAVRGRTELAAKLVGAMAAVEGVAEQLNALERQLPQLGAATAAAGADPADGRTIERQVADWRLIAMRCGRTLADVRELLEQGRGRLAGWPRSAAAHGQPDGMITELDRQTARLTARLQPIVEILASDLAVARS